MTIPHPLSRSPSLLSSTTPLTTATTATATTKQQAGLPPHAARHLHGQGRLVRVMDDVDFSLPVTCGRPKDKPGRRAPTREPSLRGERAPDEVAAAWCGGMDDV